VEEIWKLWKAGEILPPVAITESLNENQENQEPNLNQKATIPVLQRKHVGTGKSLGIIRKETAKEPVHKWAVYLGAAIGFVSKS
jgi:hypothetical protein